MININGILSSLAQHRPVFHSEADFQHAFAWEIHRHLPMASVRLELPVRVKNRFLHIDIWVVSQDVILAIELKYKTRALSIKIGNEQYHLKNQGAQDLGRYDFLKDVQRLEQVSTQYQNFIGYAIFLTNDRSYWSKSTNSNTADADFRLHSGRVIEGVLAWGETASDGTKRKREKPIDLQGKYPLQWQDYSHPCSDRHGKFRILMVNVSGILHKTDTRNL